MNEAYQIDNNIASSTVDFIWNLSIPTPSTRNRCYETQDSEHILIGREDEVSSLVPASILPLYVGDDVAQRKCHHWEVIA